MEMYLLTYPIIDEDKSDPCFRLVDKEDKTDLRCRLPES